MQTKITTRKAPLSQLDPDFLEFTDRPGVLRCHKGEQGRPRQGVYLSCPKCKGTNTEHGITILLNEPGVPPQAYPKGRWTMTGKSLLRMTLTEKIYSRERCGWEGFLIDGMVSWREEVVVIPSAPKPAPPSGDE